MAFSDAFARGYAVGESIRKKRATSKFFEKFKELTEEPPEDGGLPESIPGFNPKGKGEKAPTALPVQDAGEDGLAPVVGAEAAAIPVDVKGPESLTVATEETKSSMDKFARSLTRDNIKELDRLALDAAKASGDMEVYTALQKTTDSFLQGKTLKGLSEAQTAFVKGDTDAAEKALKKAYRYVPDGQEVDFERKDGKLWIANPWAGQEGEDDKIELNAERVGWLGAMLSDPEKFSGLIREESKDREKTRQANRALELEAGRLEVSRGELEQSERRVNLEFKRLGLDREKFAEQVKNDRVGRFTNFQQGLYYQAMAENENVKAAAGGKMDSGFLNSMRELSGEVDSQFKNYTTAPRGTDGMLADENWTKPDDIASLSNEQLGDANAYAQAIAAKNTGSSVTPMVSVKAGIAIANGAYRLDPNRGVMEFNMGGQPMQVPLPTELTRMLVAREQGMEQPGGGALPLPGPGAPRGPANPPF